jgi:hypothetical protein
MDKKNLTSMEKVSQRALLSRIIVLHKQVLSKPGMMFKFMKHIAWHIRWQEVVVRAASMLENPSAR